MLALLFPKVHITLIPPQGRSISAAHRTKQPLFAVVVALMKADSALLVSPSKRIANDLCSVGDTGATFEHCGFSFVVINADNPRVQRLSVDAGLVM
jgi:hypothetical protein